MTIPDTEDLQDTVEPCKKTLYFPKGKTIPLESTHVIFDELFSSYKVIPPVVQELRKAMGRESTTLDASARRRTGVHDTFDIITENDQFAKVRSIEISPSGNKAIGLAIETDLAMN